ncbi:MAG: hypothetical protein PHS30_10490, partial [Bacteroidales bacterium]|nr:hypothetical protein [Bacteroidales bacterium]
MNAKKRICSLLLVGIAAVSAYSQQTWYVSPAGTGNVFSKENPGNIEGLNAKLQETSGKVSGTIQVFFKGGDYFLSKPLVITNSEAGRAKDSLILSGMKGEKAVISGGRPVSKWEKTGKGIFRAKVPAGTDFRQLYVSGKWLSEPEPPTVKMKMISARITVVWVLIKR